MVDKKKCNSLHRFILETLDPVHVGAGGYRIGRVDLSIVREPGTRLPKLPGTGISGAVRHYATIFYGKTICAGQGRQDEGGKQAGHCGQNTCPICYTFGSVSGDRSFAGTVHIFDARLLFFPVYSTAGPVWVTCPDILLGLELADESALNEVTDDKVLAGPKLCGYQYLNLGWLMVGVNNYREQKKEQSGSRELSLFNNLSCLPVPVKERCVVVSDTIFPHVVNSNLEVRTSVSIDPETGAAREGALFTYEAIPRAAFLWLDVLENDFRKNENQKTWPVKKKVKYENQKWQDNAGDSLPEANIWETPIDVVKTGLEMMECMGVGGMATRGFGRIKNLGEVGINEKP